MGTLAGVELINVNTCNYCYLKGWPFGSEAGFKNHCAICFGSIANKGNNGFKAESGGYLVDIGYQKAYY